MTFNRNYLSAQSQPWAREVQKRVANLETAFRSAEVNNTTRDDQLAASFRRLDATFLETQAAAAAAEEAASDALDAINGLTGLGTPGGDYEVDGANLVVGSVTATEISSDYIYAGDISADQINAGTLSADYISGGTIDASDITVTNLNASNITTGTIDSININSVTISASTISGRLQEAPGTQSIIGPFETGDFGEVNCGIVSANQTVQANDGFLGTVNTTIASNTTSFFEGNVFINTSGNMFRSTATSSRDAKTDIIDFNFDTEAFLSINPVTFYYKPEAVNNPEEAEMQNLGFIVEDFEAVGLGDHLVIPSNEIDQYKGLRYNKLYMFLHKTVQELNERVKELENGATN